MNLPFRSRQSFIHVFQEGRRLVLKVDKTKKEIRFSFQWHPQFQRLNEVEEIVEEYEQWMDFWLGVSEGSHHDFQDFMFLESCNWEMERLCACLT